MKNLRVSKKVWKQVKKLRNELEFKHNSKTIQWLFDRSLKEENLQKITDESHGAENIKILEVKMVLDDIHARVDQIIHNENLEEKIAKKQSSVIELQCMQCGSTPFKLDKSVCDEAGIICPFCGYFHGIIIDQGGNKNETL